jgi:hypothetical protein
MLTLANPNGYLNLQQAAVSGVTPAGTGVVNGVAVTYFDVVIDNAKLLDIPGLTAEQTKTITEALAQLRAAGLQTGGTTKVGIDAAGFIRETSSTATFEDGTRQLSRTRFSNFGCAGFVTLPGEAPAPPAKPCAPTTPTTTAPAPADTTTTSVAPATTTTTLSANEPPAPAVDEFGQPLPPPGWKMPTIDGKPACDRYGPSCPAPPEG